MARKDQQSQRLVHHTAGSRADLISIYIYNDASYGESHAQNYLDFLEAQLQGLANNPATGRLLDDYPGVRVFLAKTRPRRQAAGYRIFYREVADGIEVIRVLHTSRDYPRQLL